MSKKLNDASIATITALVNTDYMNTVDPSTGEISKILVSKVKTSITGGALVYSGLISQVSTSAPTITELLNTTGATFTTARTGVGTYDIICSTTLFGAGRLVMLFTNSTPTSVGAIRGDTSHINITTTTDGVLTDCSFKIEIYP